MSKWKGMGIHMNVHVESSLTEIRIVVKGRIDTITSPELQRVIMETEFTNQDVIFDFSEVEYISSNGLRVMLIARKKCSSGNMKIVNVSEAVYSIFKMSGFSSMLHVEKGTEKEKTYIDKSFKDILKLKTESIPNKVMFSFEGISYTWEEVNKCVQVIAFDLFKLGVRKGTHVGLCSANSANWILTFFAIQKLGAVACLFNFGYTDAEISKVSVVGDVTILCYGEMTNMKNMKNKASFLSAIQNENSMIMDCYDIGNSIHFKDRMNEYASIEGLFEEKVEADDACIMIYTSGTTGVPKGVLLSAYNILNSSVTMAEQIRMSEEDKICLILPLFHIFALIACLFGSVLKDNEFYMPATLRTRSILSAIVEEKCTVIHSVPTMILALMNNAEFDSSKVTSLRCCVIGGSPVNEAQVVEMSRNFPNTHFVNLYGLSELAPVSMTNYDDSIVRIHDTVGKPVNNIKIIIQDPAAQKECETGKVGEILVEGFSLMSCYYKVDMDKQSIDESGWLHTGDLGYLDEDNYLHLAGRIKELIIRGGENIMPNEVAQVIAQHKDIADVKVVGVPHSFFGEVVCACIVMKCKTEFREADMREFLQDKLSKFKLPEYFMVYDEFPSLANGKVDAVRVKKDASEKFRS